MRSLRSKFSVLMILILILTLSVSGYFMIQRNVETLTSNVSRDALNFSDFASSTIATDFTKKFQGGEFISFSQGVLRSLQRNTDITKVRVISKDGELLFDSQTERSSQYVGPKRTINEDTLVSRLLDVKPSIRLDDGSLIYFQKNAQGVFLPVDREGKSLESDMSTSRFKTLVYPIPEETFGIEYTVSYSNVDQNILDASYRLGIMIVASILIGIIVSLFFVRQIIRPVEKLRAGAERIAQGDLDTEVTVQTHDEIGVLATTFNTMAKDLKKNTKDLLVKERLDHEISLAAQIQKDLIPKSIPQVAGLDIAASIVPASEIGGDYYDFISKDDDLMVFIGDVTGHGVSAGLVEAITSSLVYTFSHIHTQTDHLLSDMNTVIHKKTRPNVFVTAIMGLWNPRDNCFRYTNAGHDQVLHFKAAEGKAEILKKGGMALGMVPDIHELMTQEEVCIQNDDLLILYTDGIPEAWNQNKEQFSMKRLTEIIEQIGSKGTAQEIHDAIIAHVREFMGSSEQMDDITLIVLKKV